MSRKGYFGMVAMSAVDSWGRFRMSALEWSGITHDSVAFCDLYKLMSQQHIPEDLYIIGDEAFCSIGSQMLTPYPKRGLRSTSDANPLLKMRIKIYEGKKSRIIHQAEKFQQCTIHSTINY